MGQQNIIAQQGAALLIALTGSVGVLTGRALLMHARSETSDITVKLAASTTDGRLTVTGPSSASLAVGSDVMALLPVGNPTETWVFDVESSTSPTDVRREWWGSFTITRDVTRDTEAVEEDRLAGLVRYDPQVLTDAQKLVARTNIGAGTGGGGGSGDVVGPASATDDRIAAFDGITGKLIKQGAVTATEVAAHLTSTADPHGDRAFATAAVGTHAGAADPHGDRAFATAADSAHSALTSGVHGITAAGAALIDDADASAQRTTLGLGTAATQASGAFEAAGSVATHAALTTVHGISAFGATLVDDASAAAARTTIGLVIGTDVQAYDAELAAIAGLTSAADKGIQFTGAGAAATFDLTAAGKALLDDADATAQRATLGLGTAATTASTAYATAAQGTDARTPLAHNHAAGEITSGTMATARLGSGTADATTFLRGDQTYATPAGGGTSGPIPKLYSVAQFGGL